MAVLQSERRAGDMLAKPHKPSAVRVLIVDKAIVIVSRRWRSKWWKIECGCSKWLRRKDGTCKHERAVLERIRPELRDRFRIVEWRAGE